MRFAVFAVLFALPGIASAADYGLPPPPEEIEPAPVQFNWTGIYGGIHAAYANADYTTTELPAMLAGRAYYAAIESDMAQSFVRIDNSSSAAGPGYGGFIGYNWDWDGAVVGIEADFTAFSNLKGSALMPPIGRRTTINGLDVTVRAQAGIESELDNVTLLKLRGGVPFGTFMPYGTIGLALGYQRLNAHYESYFIEADSDGNVLAAGPANASIRKNGFVPGLAGGIGVDWAILPHLLLRAEYQYVAFANYKNLQSDLNMVRVGVGLRY